MLVHHLLANLVNEMRLVNPLWLPCVKSNHCRNLLTPKKPGNNYRYKPNIVEYLNIMFSQNSNRDQWLVFPPHCLRLCTEKQCTRGKKNNQTNTFSEVEQEQGSKRRSKEDTSFSGRFISIPAHPAFAIVDSPRR